MKGLPIILVTRIVLVRRVALEGILPHMDALSSREIHLLVRRTVRQPLVDYLVWVDRGAVLQRLCEVTLHKAHVTLMQ